MPLDASNLCAAEESWQTVRSQEHYKQYALKDQLSYARLLSLVLDV